MARIEEMVELFPDYWFDRLVDTTVPALMSLGRFETYYVSVNRYKSECHCNNIGIFLYILSKLKSSFGCENSSGREVLFGWKSYSEKNKSQRAIATGKT